MRTLPSALCAALVLASSALGAQSTGQLYGRAYDQFTGAPLEGALVAAWYVGQGRQPTDSLGQFTYRYLRPGSGLLEVTCPSKAAIGRPTPMQVVVFVQSGRAFSVDVPVDTRDCTEPPLSARYAILGGFYRPEFESVTFEPCPDSTGQPLLWQNPYWAQGAWTFFTDAAVGELNTMWPPVDNPSDTVTYYARFRGTLTGPGARGRRSGIAYQMEVDSVLELRLPRPDDCH